MPVNVNSVISSAINTFDPALYTAITNKEDYVYTSGTNGRLTECQPAFTQLNSAIITWMGTDRHTKISDLITGLYSYKIMADMYGTSSSLLSSSDSRSIFTMNGYRSRIQSDILTYYDDYPLISFDSATKTINRNVGSWITDGFTVGMSVTVSNSVNNNITFTVAANGVTTSALTVVETVITEAAKSFVQVIGTGNGRLKGTHISSDIALIIAAFTTQESPVIDNLINSYPSSVKGKIHDLLFQNIVAGSPLSKLQMAQYIFNTLHYKEVYDNLNVTLTVPPLV